jgi:hypothetical protein
MRQRIALLFCFAALPLSVSLAQTNCPEGLKYAGLLSGSGSYGAPFDQKVFISLPRGANPDTTYQQNIDLHATNGRSGVTSNLRTQDIPKGIYVHSYGKSDSTYEQGWAVSDPELKEVKNAEGKVVRYKFGMHLFCKVGTTGANPQFGECAVEAEVCYKPSK